MTIIKAKNGVKLSVGVLHKSLSGGSLLEQAVRLKTVNNKTTTILKELLSLLLSVNS